MEKESVSNCGEDDRPHKRTYEEMSSTSNQTQAVKYNIAEVRVELVQKLPELKDSIMNLTDEEIQNILMESTKATKQAKPVPPSKQPASKEKNKIMTRSADHDKLNGKHDNITQKELFKAQNKNESTEVLEFNTEEKSKKIKTIVLIHTEE